MVNKVDLKFIISGLGRYEETILKGYEKGEFFYLGNDGKEKVYIEDVDLNKVTLRLEDNSLLNFPHTLKKLDIPKNEEINIESPMKPSPDYSLEILDIREEPIRFYE